MSKVIRGYKYRIYPTEEQAERINGLIHYTRFAYNWAVEKEYKLYEQYKLGNSEYGFYSYIDLEKLFLEELKINPKMQWIKDNNYPTSILKYTFMNLVNGFDRFFKGQNKGKPWFKSKKHCKKAFPVRYDRFYIKNNKVRFTGVGSYIDLGFDCGLNVSKVMNSTSISLDNLGNYYISFSLEEENEELEIPKSEGVGIDIGIRQTFVLSTGEIYNQPKEKLEKLEKKRRRQQRRVTRDINRRKEIGRHTKTKYEDIPKSKRAIKREIKLLKTYRKIHNIKDTFYHNITKKIVDRNPEYVCMETFGVTDIQTKRPYMNDKIVNVSFYDITRKMRYKCEKYNIPFISAPQEFPSTQLCNNCGYKKDLHGNHVYKCPVCGMKMDRDINAAINLRNYGSQFIL